QNNLGRSASRPPRPAMIRLRLSAVAVVFASALAALPADDPKPAEKGAEGEKYTSRNGMVLIRVARGKFWMGSPEDEADRIADREPQREVTVGYDFYIGQYEVTQKEWQALMGRNPSYFSRTGGGKDKVRGVSDDDLARFPVETVS